MRALELAILNKRQELRDLLRYALNRAPISLNVVKTLKMEISVCDCALNELYSKQAKSARLG